MVTQNHSGSGHNIAANTVNIGRQDFELTQFALDEITHCIAREGGGKTVYVKAVGSNPKSVEIASAITQHLRSKGFVVEDGYHVMQRFPPMERAIAISPDVLHDGLAIEIDASIGQ